MRCRKRLAGTRKLRLLCAGLAVVLASCTTSPTALRPDPGTHEPDGAVVWDGEPLVQTSFGAVQGYSDADDTWVWRGIPYARPPVGDLRWRAPRDPEPWNGVRRSRRFAASCTQYNPLLRGVIAGSEDCLYLNIWRPRSAEDDLPVYVWIHGGGNSIGSASYVPDYYGHRVANRSNVIFVSINYRLGPFGWFFHPALQERIDPADDSGNYGTLDIIQALRWVKMNIARFGGDPETVLVSGESAGGMNVLSLLISPQAAGLFSSALCQSGSPNASDLEEGMEASAAVVCRLLVRDGLASDVETAGSVIARMSPEEIRAYLRSKSDRDILKCYESSFGGMIANPAIFTDGYVLPEEGFDALRTGSHLNKVPTILGSNSEELKLFLAFNPGFSWKSARYQAIARYGSALWKARGADGVARDLASHPDHPGVYVYHFLWGAPDERGRSPLPGDWGRRLGAFHTLEIPFFLGTDTIEGRPFTWLLFRGANEAGRKTLSEAMMAYVGSFLRTGDPNGLGAGLPTWARWTNAAVGPKSIVFDADEARPDGESIDIRMTTVEYTHESVCEAMYRELPRPLCDETFRYFAGSNNY